MEDDDNTDPEAENVVGAKEERDAVGELEVGRNQAA